MQYRCHAPYRGPLSSGGKGVHDCLPRLPVPFRKGKRIACFCCLLPPQHSPGLPCARPGCTGVAHVHFCPDFSAFEPHVGGGSLVSHPTKRLPLVSPCWGFSMKTLALQPPGSSPCSSKPAAIWPAASMAAAHVCVRACGRGSRSPAGKGSGLISLGRPQGPLLDCLCL